MARRLTLAFTNRKVIKYYTGLSFKKASSKKKQGWIQGYMKRGRRKSWYLVASSSSSLNDDGAGKSNKGNPSPNCVSQKDDSTTGVGAVWAQTYFWTAGLGHLMDQYQPPFFSFTHESNSTRRLAVPRTLMLFRPHTGRTHQLRVASKSLGLPLAGDPLYTTSSSSSIIDWNGGNDNADGPTTASTTVTIPRTCLHATGLYIPAECLGLQEDLTLCSLPPFLQWWQQPGGLEPHLVRLLEKDATVPPPLLKAVKHAASLRKNNNNNNRDDAE